MALMTKCYSLVKNVMYGYITSSLLYNHHSNSKILHAADEEKVPCYCKSQNCCGGLKSKRVARKHKIQDRKLSSPMPDLQNMIYERDLDFDEQLYNTHELATEELYPGSPVSVLEAIFLRFKTFACHPYMSKESITETFQYDNKFLLPKNNKMPSSFREAKQKTNQFLVKLEKYDTCKNDCLIYKDAYAKKTCCFFCKQERYSSGAKPNKTFTYFPLGPRLARYYGTVNLAKLMQYHCNNQNLSNFIHDLTDTQKWRNEWYAQEGIFNGDINSAALAFSTDGLCPWRAIGSNYSMWPLVIQMLNMPPVFRKTIGCLMVVGIVPGNGRAEPNTLEPYICILVDELLQLSGCAMVNAYTNAPFKMKAKLLHFVLDFPAVSKVLHFPATGAIRGCPWCTINGQYNKHLHKTVYLQNRRYLESSSVLRSDDTNFPECSCEIRVAPERIEYEKVIDFRKKFDTLPNQNQKKLFMRENGTKGTYQFMRLKEHRGSEQIIPDGMHTIKDCVVHLIELLNGSKNMTKVAAAEEHARGTDAGRYDLTVEEKDLVNERCESLVFTLNNTGVKGAVLKRLSILKNTHAWLEYVSQNIWVFLLRGCLDQKQRRTMFFLLKTLMKSLANEIEVSDSKELIREMNIALSLLERDFPITMQNITTHLLRHMVEGIESFGPLHNTWMFPFERLNSWFTRRVLNRQYPEATIMETYQIYDWVMYCMFSNKFPKNGITTEAEFHEIENLLSEESHDDIVNEEVFELELITKLHSSEREHIRSIIQCELNLIPSEGRIISKVTIRKCLNRLTYSTKQSIHRTSDIVYMSCLDRYGKISQIVKVVHGTEDHTFFWVNLFKQHSQELESNFHYVDNLSLCEQVFLSVKEVSEPLITSNSDEKLWFVSSPCIGKLEYSWLESHIEDVL